MFDRVIIEFDKILKNLFHAPYSTRPHPDMGISEADLTDRQRKHLIGLMRVNHCGEICAQGLYQGQGITAKNKANQKAFEDAAYEEVEHLAWTKQRIEELGGQTSILNPLFYTGSLAMGIVAGIFGDKWNLAFLEETEKQVESHLTKHLAQIPENDLKTKAILEQMKLDEAKHADMAHEAGAATMPELLAKFMRLTSSIMTKSTYYI